MIARLEPLDRYTDKPVPGEQKLKRFSRCPCLVKFVTIPRRSNRVYSLFLFAHGMNLAAMSWIVVAKKEADEVARIQPRRVGSGGRGAKAPRSQSNRDEVGVHSTRAGSTHGSGTPREV